MKQIIIVLFVVFFSGQVWAADTKISAFTSDAAPTTDDLIATVDDPGGTPANKKVTLGALETLISHDAVTIASGTGSITVTGQELDVSGILEEFTDLTPTNNAILGFTGSGAIENKTSISVDIDIGVGEETTAGRLGRTTANQITMGDNAGTGTVYFAPYGAPTASKSVGYTIGTDAAEEAYGGTIYVTSAATITAPAVTARMSFTVVTIGAIAVSLDVNASDKMVLDGVTLDDGDKATNTSTAGDIIHCVYYSADGWYCASGSPDGDHWTDGGA